MTAKRTIPIESAIVVARGHRVILAADLARIYGVETRVLNQAVKRNLEKFPGDFIFRLTRDEAETLSRSRSQSVILKRGQNIKFLPYKRERPDHPDRPNQTEQESFPRRFHVPADIKGESRGGHKLRPPQENSDRRER